MKQREVSSCTVLRSSDERGEVCRNHVRCMLLAHESPFHQHRPRPHDGRRGEHYAAWSKMKHDGDA
jgi:hypothetical protein